MSRYDLINKKGRKKKEFVSAPDTIGTDLQKFNNIVADNPDEAVGAHTAIRGKNLMLRGPNGYQVSIPLRHIEIRMSGEYWLKLPQSIATTLQADIQSAQNDPSEIFRIGDLRRTSEPFGFRRLS
jgi:hypothetical protein